jgi:signal peptidase II
MTATRRRLTVCLTAAAGVVAADQITKAWAVRALADGPIDVAGSAVRFNLTRNAGGAFSSFQGLTPVLAVAAIVVSVVLARTVATTTDRLRIAALTLVLGGALGNLADRIFRAPGFLRGHVVDFVDVGPWPVFNVADSAITVGIVLLVVGALRSEIRDRAP